jgi:hypothetical protein
MLWQVLAVTRPAGHKTTSRSLASGTCEFPLMSGSRFGRSFRADPTRFLEGGPQPNSRRKSVFAWWLAWVLGRPHHDRDFIPAAIAGGTSWRNHRSFW